MGTDITSKASLAASAAVPWSESPSGGASQHIWVLRIKEDGCRGKSSHRWDLLRYKCHTAFGEVNVRRQPLLVCSYWLEARIPVWWHAPVLWRAVPTCGVLSLHGSSVVSGCGYFWFYLCDTELVDQYGIVWGSVS